MEVRVAEPMDNLHPCCGHFMNPRVMMTGAAGEEADPFA